MYNVILTSVVFVVIVVVFSVALMIGLRFATVKLIELMLIHVGRRTKLARELKDDFGLIHFGMGVNEGADIVCDPEMVIQKISILKGEN